jgi:hypothetical protein
MFPPVAAAPPILSGITQKMEAFGIGADTPARPKVLNHLVKAVLSGGCLFGIASMLWAISSTPEMGLPLLAAVAIGLVIGWPFLALVLRNLHALVVRPQLTLLPDSIHVRYWAPVTFPCWAMFRPTYKMLDRTVPLSEFKGCRTFTHSVNSIPVHKAVIISTATGEIEIGWDVFRPGVGRIQTRILDYFEGQVLRPAREAARLSEFQRRRFREPLDYSGKVSGPTTAAVLLAITVAAIVVLQQLVPSFYDTAWVWIPLATGFVGLYALLDWWRGRPFRYIRLDADGLAMGPSSAAARLIPWDQILFVRRHTKSSSYGNRDAAALTTGVEIRQTNGDSTVVLGMAHAPLEELAAFIDPPVDLVQQAHQRIAAGESPEAAAAAVGLRPRPGTPPSR